MYEVSKEAYERRLKASQWSRKWIIIPCLCVNVALLGHAVLANADLIVMWTCLTIMQTVNLWSNGEMSKIYTRMIDHYNDMERAEKTRQLNPHRK